MTQPSQDWQSKLRGGLVFAMRDSQEQTFDVIVTFARGVTPPADVPGLYVTGNMGQGRLSRDAIRSLALRDDVLEIELEPKDRPFRPDSDAGGIRPPLDKPQVR